MLSWCDISMILQSYFEHILTGGHKCCLNVFPAGSFSPFPPSPPLPPSPFFLSFPRKWLGSLGDWDEVEINRAFATAMGDTASIWGTRSKTADWLCRPKACGMFVFNSLNSAELRIKTCLILNNRQTNMASQLCCTLLLQYLKFEACFGLLLWDSALHWSRWRKSKFKVTSSHDQVQVDSRLNWRFGIWWWIWKLHLLTSKLQSDYTLKCTLTWNSWNLASRLVARSKYFPRQYHFHFGRASTWGSGSMLPKIAGNAPKFYELVHIFQLYMTIFPPRNSVLNVDQL